MSRAKKEETENEEIKTTKKKKLQLQKMNNYN